MGEYLNSYPLTSFAGIVADCMGVTLPESYAPSIGWVSKILQERLGGQADRAILYHADAVGQYIWQQYTDMFAPLYRYTNMAVPYVSTVMSVTPVAHASMYTGLTPEQHGIQRYVRPQLTCSTLYDVLLEQGKHPCIVTQRDSTFAHIFTGRDMPCIEEPDGAHIGRTALRLMEEDSFDVISMHNCDYDTEAHHSGPESEKSLETAKSVIDVFAELAEYVRQNWSGRHRTLLVFAPDHGQHTIDDNKGAHGSLLPEDMNILHFFGTII